MVERRGDLESSSHFLEPILLVIPHPCKFLFDRTPLCRQAPHDKSAENKAGKQHGASKQPHFSRNGALLTKLALASDRFGIALVTDTADWPFMSSVALVVDILRSVKAVDVLITRDLGVAFDDRVTAARWRESKHG